MGPPPVTVSPPAARPARVVVDAPARLHLGFLDLHGGCGRLFGSIGVALERPRCLVEARPAARAEAGGPSAEEVLGVLERLRRRLGDPAVAVRTLETIPRHAGFGSGTQLELAVALAASRALGHAPPVRELAEVLRRGRRSGIGIAVFERGGFVVDAGHLDGSPDLGAAGSGPDGVPPVIFQHPLPEDWFFVIVTPQGVQGLSGTREDGIFGDLPVMGEDTVGRICRLALMRVIPAVITDDIEGFGDAITEIQTLVGEHFALHQGGVYATATGRDVVAFALKMGAHGVGQSSWGPTVFALVRGEPTATDLVAAIREFLRDDPSLVAYTRARNRGAAVRIEP